MTYARGMIEPYIYNYYLSEAEDESEDPDEGFEAAGGNDEDPNAGGEENTEEDAGDSEEESPDDSGEETEDPNVEEDGSEDTEGEEAGDDGLDIDASDDTGEEESGEEDPNEDDSSDDSSTDEEEVDPDSLKALDGKIYADLSPAEQKMKLIELRRLYTDLFTSCNTVADKINTMVIDDDDAKLQIRRAGSMMFDLGRMVSDYFLKIFDSKSYEENDIMFNRFLAFLNGINGLTEDLKKLYKDDSK